MEKKTLPNNQDLENQIRDLEEAVDELELLLLEESFERDELAEEVELLKEQLKGTPKIIIKEIHHHYPQWNYIPPLQIQTWPIPLYPGSPTVYCNSGTNGNTLC